MEQSILRDVDKACRAIQASELKSYLNQRFNNQRIIIFKKYNLLAIPIEKKYGGRGASYVTYMAALQRIAQEGSSLRTFFSVHTSLGQLTLQQQGSEAQKKKYLPSTVTGEKLMGFALTEPTAGSDPASMKTTFKETSNHFILNGTKTWIGHATEGKLFITFAKDKKGIISAFIIESAIDGFSSERIANTIGLRNHDVGTIYLNNCKIPKANMLGKRGQGLHIAYDAILNGRLSIAAGSIGVMENCLQESITYAKKRRQHHKSIAKHQLIQRHLAKISTHLEAARALVDKAIEAKIAYNKKPTKQHRTQADVLIAQAKYFASNASFDAADRAVQIHGGHGYDLITKVARHFCDERVTRIYEGTNEILQLKIAMSLLGKEYEAFD